MKKLLLAAVFTLLATICVAEEVQKKFSYEHEGGYELKYETNSDTTVTCVGLGDSVKSSDFGINLVIPDIVTYDSSEFAVTTIGQVAFQYSSMLASVSIPNTVDSIGSCSFQGITTLKSIDVDSENKKYCSVDGVLYSKDTTILMVCPGKKAGAFVIPETVTNILSEAFMYCSDLEYIESKSVTPINAEDYAFDYIFPPIIVPNQEAVKLYEAAGGGWIDLDFYDATSAYKVTFDASGADGNMGLQMFRKDSVTALSTNMLRFEGHEFLGWDTASTATKVVYTNEQEITVNSDMTLYAVWFASSFIASTGEGYELSYKTDSTDIRTVTCSSLNEKSTVSDLVIPDTVVYNGIAYSVTSIGYQAFYNGTNLEGTLTIPSSVTNIGESAFEGCSGLSRVVMQHANVPEISNIETSKVFDGLAENATLNLPNADVYVFDKSDSSLGEDGKWLGLNIEYSANINLSNNDILVNPDVKFPIIYTVVDSIPLPELTKANSDTLGGSYTTYEFVGWNNGKDTITAINKGTTGDLELTAVYDSLSLIASIRVEVDTILVTAGKQTRTVLVDSDVDWNVQVDSEDWISVEKTSGLDGAIAKSFTISVDSNTTIQRQAKVFLTAANVDTAWVTVIQQDSMFVNKNIEDITAIVDSVFEQINLSEYFSYADYSKVKFYSNSEHENVAALTVNGTKIGIIPYSAGETKVTLYAESIWGAKNKMEFSITVTDTKEIVEECPEFSITETITNIKGCPGEENGAIAINVSGGAAPYKFRWSNTQTGNEINNLAAGKYSVVVRDSLGCTEIHAYSVEGIDSIKFAPTFTPPGCGQSNGSIDVNVTGGTGECSYKWSNDSTNSSISNISAGVYTLEVVDANDCQYSEAITLNSQVSPTIKIDSVKDTKCNISNGEIHVSVSGGTPPYILEWSDGKDGEFSRTDFAVGVHNLVVTDANKCTAGLSQRIESISFLDPAIGLVSVDRVTGNNLVIWQKEETKEVDYYYIYRENLETKEFDSIDKWEYNNTSVYEDVVADASERSWRYKLQAVNECGDKSRMSKSFKTMHMDSIIVQDNGVLLAWDDYEGELYPTYAIYRLYKNGDTALVARVPSHTSYYFDENPQGHITGYVVAVEMPEEFNVNDNLLKAESGPFSLALSNIAEVEINTEDNTEIKNRPSVLNQISVYPTIVKDFVTVKVGDKQAQVSLYSLIGEKLYDVEVSESTVINMASMPCGAYTVVVTIDGVGYGFKIVR